MITKFGSIADKNDETFQYLVQVNDRCHLIFTWFAKIVVGAYLTVIPVFSIGSMISCWVLDKELVPANFYHPYEIV